MITAGEIAAQAGYVHFSPENGESAPVALSISLGGRDALPVGSGFAGGEAAREMGPGERVGFSPARRLYAIASRIWAMRVRGAEGGFPGGSGPEGEGGPRDEETGCLLGARAALEAWRSRWPRYSGAPGGQPVS